DEIHRVATYIAGKWPSILAVLDGSLAFILGSSPALTHLDIFPLLCCTDYGDYGTSESSVVPLTTAALQSLKNLRHLTPNSGGAAASSSISASPFPSPSPSPSGAATKRHLKVHCPLRIVRDLGRADDSVETIREAEKMGWEVVREGGTTSIDCRGETTEGPPTAETLAVVETIKRHAGGGDPTSPHFSGIQFDNASTLDITLSTHGPDVDAESFNSIPNGLIEETTLKSLSNVTEFYLSDINGGSYGISTCDPEYLIPPATPNRLSRLLSSLPARTHVDFDYSTAHAILASEALAYIQQGITKPLKKLEIVYDEPLFFNKPRTKAAAPVAFPSPDTPRQYPTVEELSIEIKPIEISFVGVQAVYNARAESVPERLRDLFRLVHELRPKHATFKLSERADTFAAPGDGDQVESELDLLFRESRVRDDMAEYGMKLRFPNIGARYNGKYSSIEELEALPREHELAVEMAIWPLDNSDADGEEREGLDDEEGWTD
ncbi:unnamed protein product, partial [Vitrella brassicaformis CCMP3155]